MGPNYTPPETKVSETWHTAMDGGLDATTPNPEALSQWWQVLNDPVLSALIYQAVVGNLDLKEAQARVREARAKRGSGLCRPVSDL